jgi:molybdate transport system ATP-binding protein
VTDGVTNAAVLSVRLRHRFESAAMDMAFDVPAAGVTVLFGPSGSGKSTLIAAAAGLLRPDLCRIAVGADILVDTEAGIWLPPERRRIGLVFQDARLFPHMSVATNLRYGMRRAPSARDGSGPIGFDTVVDLLGIGLLLRRRPHTLSGGERQRVAIGRALLAQPRLLLMDEPLASLDPARKSEILPFLAALRTTLRLPVIYVTHAPDEVNRLADSIVLIAEGRVAAFGALADIAGRADLALARRDDAAAVLEATVVAHDTTRALSRLEAGGVAWWVPLLDRPAGTACRIRIPAREVILAARAPDAISLHNIVPGHVQRVEAAGGAVLVEVRLPAGAVLARVTPDAVERLSLQEGAPVLALVKSTSIEVIG